MVSDDGGLNACAGGVAARQQRWRRDGVFAGTASLRQKAAMCLSEDQQAEPQQEKVRTLQGK